MNFIDKEDFKQDDILKIIESKLEESINIEFKNSKALSNDKMVKKEISKDISAFANSDGGIIFYGIDEENHVASNVSFVDGNEFSKEWLENIIISTIQQKIENLKIIPVRFDGDIKKTIYVVKIPKSLNSPHINADKKYYRRHNFQSVPMEEYDVRSSYLKSHDCQVEVEGVFFKSLGIKNNCYQIRVEIHIVNHNYGIAEKYKIACDIINGSNYSISFDNSTDYNVTHKEHCWKVSSNRTIAIFQNEILNALSFNLIIKENNFEEAVNDMKLNVIIYSLEVLSQTEYNIGNTLLEMKKGIDDEKASY